MILVVTGGRTFACDLDLLFLDDQICAEQGAGDFLAVQAMA